MKVQITKRKDGDTVLRCVRADGSVSWQKQTGQHARFFPLHDLTHFAVESELNVPTGFFGLVAMGWDIDETGQRGVATQMPVESLYVENVVGTLDSERASMTRWTAAEFNENIERHLAKGGRTPPPRQLTDDDLARIRKRRAELFEAWHELPEGETLDLDFTPRTDTVVPRPGKWRAAST